MGVSQGGMVAQYLAAEHPEKVEKLILVVTAPYANDVAKNAVSGWIDMAKRGEHEALMTDTAEKMYSKKYLYKYRKISSIVASFTKPDNYERFFANANAILNFDARGELEKIKCQTLILSGNDDNTVGNDAPRELKAGIPNSDMFIYNGLGHGIFEEESKDFYGKVFDFCKG
jgi:pimeloyl-ACP methyl ester carboxylesterase